MLSTVVLEHLMRGGVQWRGMNAGGGGQGVSTRTQGENIGRHALPLACTTPDPSFNARLLCSKAIEERSGKFLRRGAIKLKNFVPKKGGVVSSEAYGNFGSERKPESVRGANPSCLRDSWLQQPEKCLCFMAMSCVVSFLDRRKFYSTKRATAIQAVAPSPNPDSSISGWGLKGQTRTND